MGNLSINVIEKKRSIIVIKCSILLPKILIIRRLAMYRSLTKIIKP
jgi:hypothetical protein